MQSKLNSLKEVIITSTGKFIIVTASQILYFKYIMGLDISFQGNMGWAITAFTLSFMLGYFFRRHFNKGSR